ncbi:MAG TPA: GIY-YIG nuclease family protein [Candidatus Angelobacter sp.]|jgi:putative endonuclease
MRHSEAGLSYCIDLLQRGRGNGSAALWGKMKQFRAYIMSNKSRRLYTGMSSDLPQRVNRHKLMFYSDSFTARYSFDTLVWYEEHPNFRSARAREVELKGWRREKKLALILAANPDWADLSLEWQDNPGWKIESDAVPRVRRRKSEP